MPTQFQPNDRKLEELILYLAEQSEEDPGFSDTKLNKLLFFADFRAYEELGKPITGHRYQKLPYGPAPVALLPVVGRMESSGSCERYERRYHGRTQRRLRPLRSPDLDRFTAEEIRLIDEVVEEFRDLNASQISELSHRLPGWQAVGMQEEIPYPTIFVLPPRPLTRAEVEHGQALAET